ncbi:hypothetical protein ACQ9BO_14855 [Flavobacterium sp. P21]|uniref:hypothetical protein n=1 Tax=Flavobacterium sp. P21 TaxID=3423948 RepID=UPI003D672525
MKTKIILSAFIMLTFWCNAQTTDPVLKEVKKLLKPATKRSPILQTRTTVLLLLDIQRMLACFRQIQSQNVEQSK